MSHCLKYTCSKRTNPRLLLATQSLLKTRLTQNIPLNPTSSVDKQNLHTSSSMKEIYEIDGADDFREKVISSKIPVIVNFHADWCEPCHALKPLLEKMVTENAGKLHLAEVLVDTHPELLQAFDVSAVPAVLAVQRGQVTDKFIGFVTNKEIKTFIEGILEENA